MSWDRSVKRVIIGVCVGFILTWVPILALGQEPDSRGEAVLKEPSYKGTRANAPIPAEMHIRNEGGSDGAGLCVISSVLINGQYQGVPGIEVGRAKESKLWKAAKAAPGGYSPPKLAQLVERVMPGEKYASYVGTDTEILSRVSRMGLPIGVTMNTGALYNYRPIHHMVSLAHYDSKYACVIDNNRPGFYSFMPRAEFDRRWIDGGTGWAWFWTRKPAIIVAAGGGLALCYYGAALVFVRIGRERRARSLTPEA